MNHCETCRHWTAPTPPVLWGECRRIDSCVDINKPTAILRVTDPAFVPDCQTDDGTTCQRLQTLGDEFGCVLWEAA